MIRFSSSNDCGRHMGQWSKYKLFDPKILGSNPKSIFSSYSFQQLFLVTVFFFSFLMFLVSALFCFGSFFGMHALVTSMHFV